MFGLCEPKGQNVHSVYSGPKVYLESSCFLLWSICSPSSHEYSCSRKTEKNECVFSFYWFFFPFLFLSLPLKNKAKQNKKTWKTKSTVRNDPSHSVISSENYSYYVNSRSSFLSLQPLLPNLLATKTNCKPVECYCESFLSLNFFQGW